jgi:hypothetical protein
MHHWLDISPRYPYGKLRLGRVNLIYWVCHRTRSPKTFIRGYLYVYRKYSSFVEQNFAWVLTAIVYITIVLTAMQVGLGTTELQNSISFNRASAERPQGSVVRAVMDSRVDSTDGPCRRGSDPRNARLQVSTASSAPKSKLLRQYGLFREWIFANSLSSRSTFSKVLSG